MDTLLGENQNLKTLIATLLFSILMLIIWNMKASRSNMKTNIFGTINFNNLEEVYECTLNIEGQTIDVELVFDSEELDEDYKNRTIAVIEQIEEFTKIALQKIEKDQSDKNLNECLTMYLNHHLNEFTDKDKVELFGSENLNKNDLKRFVKLRHINVTPEEEEDVVSVDFGFPEKYTNYILTFKFNISGNIIDIAVES